MFPLLKRAAGWCKDAEAQMEYIPECAPNGFPSRRRRLCPLSHAGGTPVRLNQRWYHEKFVLCPYGQRLFFAILKKERK